MCWKQVIWAALCLGIVSLLYNCSTAPCHHHLFQLYFLIIFVLKMKSFIRKIWLVWFCLGNAEGFSTLCSYYSFEKNVRECSLTISCHSPHSLLTESCFYNFTAHVVTVSEFLQLSGRARLTGLLKVSALEREGYRCCSLLTCPVLTRMPLRATKWMKVTFIQ